MSFILLFHPALVTMTPVILIYSFGMPSGLKAKRSSCPFMVNLFSPIPTSMCALAMLKKGLPRMINTFEFGCMSSTITLQNF